MLKFVHASNRISNKCYLVMEHENTKYVGCLIFKDVELCDAISNLLRRQVGRKIKDVGDLEVSGLL